MKEAVVIVTNGSLSIRSAAERMSVAKSRLHEYVKKIKRTDSSEIDKEKGLTELCMSSNFQQR